MALAVCADVLVLEDEAGSMCKNLATHADRVCDAFHRGVPLCAFHTYVARFQDVSVGVPIKVVSFTLDPEVKGIQAINDHVSCELSPEKRLSCSNGICVPNEGGFGVVYYNQSLPAFNI